eukprot:jgi/Chrzof1/12448/Cz06g34300.t1
MDLGEEHRNGRPAKLVGQAGYELHRGHTCDARGTAESHRIPPNSHLISATSHGTPVRSIGTGEAKAAGDRRSLRKRSWSARLVMSCTEECRQTGLAKGHTHASHREPLRCTDTH